MGSFNVSCSVSHITIHEGERTFLFPLLPNINKYEIQEGHPDDGTLIINPASQYIHPDEYYIPFCFPIEGKYDDYGSLEDIVENENTKAIENFLGISINDFVALVTDGRGKNPFDIYSVFYEVFFDKKEYMEKNVQFDDFLIGMGFEQNGMRYISPGEKYKVEKIADRYILRTDQEISKPIQRKLDSFNLNDPYYAKKNLLITHALLEKEYLGLRNVSAYEITRKLSGMFVNGDIYDFLTEKKDMSGDCHKNMKVSRYYLREIGFNQTKNKDFINGEVVVDYDGYCAVLKRNNRQIKTYKCNELINAYEELTGEKLMISEVFDCDEVECQFEDMVEDFKETKKTLLNKILHADQPGQEIEVFLAKYDFESGMWKKEINGLRLLKRMKYFFELYEKMIEDKSLKVFYTSYIRFFKNMYNVNSMFFPTFQGMQSGNLDAEKALAMKILEVIDKRFYEDE